MANKTVTIFGEIFPEAEFFGGTSFKSFREEFNKDLGANDSVTVEIFSPGGSVIEGLAIYDFLRSQKNEITTKIIGLAGSIASVIALAGDRRLMTENSDFFIHNPSTLAEGDAEQLLEKAGEVARIESRLIDIYSRFTDIPTSELDNLMKKETSFSADQALTSGFITEIIEPVKAVALTTNFNDKMKKSKSLIDRIGQFLNQAEEVQAVMVTDSEGNQFELETETVEEGMEVSLEDGAYTAEGGVSFEVSEGVVTSVGEPAPEEEEETAELAEKIDKLLEGMENLKAENDTLKETNQGLQEEITNVKKYTASKKVPAKAVGTVGHQAVETGDDPESKRRPFSAGGIWAERQKEIKERHAKTIKNIRRAG